MRIYSIGREELKGVKMAKELTSETRTTNRFLHDIEQWRETDVNDYKRKVGFELSEAWTEAIIIFALMFTVFGYVWALIATALPKTMNDTAKGCIAFAIYIIFTAAAAYVMSNKNLKKFVNTNRGEVGHKGKPYYKKVLLMIPVSLIIGIAINAVLWIVFIKDFGNFTTDDLGSIQPLICAAMYPFFYYLFGFLHLVKLQKHTCPVCGRFDSVATEKIATYGKNREGREHVTKTQTKKVGEEQTIAKYSDGSTRVISAKPIYANVIVDEYDMEYGTVMNDYITYCRHCSYIKTGTREQSYSSRMD